MKRFSTVQINRGGISFIWCVMWSLIMQMSENDYMWAINKFGYNIKLCTDCFLDKWACTKKLAQPKTFFSSKSWRSFSKERLHSTDTCHFAILINIEKKFYKKMRSFVTTKSWIFYPLLHLIGEPSLRMICCSKNEKKNTFFCVKYLIISIPNALRMHVQPLIF